MTEFPENVDPTSEVISDLLNTVSKNTQSTEQNQRQCQRCLKKLHKDNIMHTCTPHKDWKGD
jgi:hypothetical protein